MYAIETNGLSKIFGSFKAVDNLELRVPEGSVYGFLGPNGAGKTTTIKMLTGLSKPSEGQIKIFGNEVNFGSSKNREIMGYLPDVPGFYDWMNPVEYLTFTGSLMSIDKTVLKTRVDELLELVGLTGNKKKIGGFSRGMKQRLGIAQALINNPRIVFLDEPTSALDPIGRKEVMDIINKLSGKVTVFFSTHILSDIERVCDRIVILDKGKVRVEDAIVNLRHQYVRPGIQIELDERYIDGITDALKQEKWVTSVVTENDSGLRIYVNDMGKAQLNIPQILSSREIALKKFAVLEPTLEDIFLKVVDNK